MGELIPNSSWQAAKRRRKSRWTKPDAYHSTDRRTARRQTEWRRKWGFPLILAALPLGVFTAIFLAPGFHGTIGTSGTEAKAAVGSGPAPVIARADPGPRTAAELEAAQPAFAPQLPGTGQPSGQRDRGQAYFPICSGGRRVTCVVDGDTIWYRGQKIRLVGFDTPEISRPGCAREQQLGERAKYRLQEWLNQGAFSLEPNPEGRSEDRYGRSLLVVSRGGERVGDVLLAEGLAERRGGRGNGWC